VHNPLTTEPRSDPERLTDDILDGIGEAFFSLDRNWRLVYFNRACEDFFGRSRDRVIGHVVWDLFPAVVGSEFERRYRRAMEDRIPVEFQTESAVRPGHCLNVRAFPIRQGLGIAFRDVSARNRREAALRESEARFRHMADSAPALIWMTDAEGQITFANMHYDHMFGLPASDMHGDGWRSILVPDDVQGFEDAFAEAFRERRPFHAEMRVRDKEDRVRWLRCEGVPRLDDAGAFLGYTGCNVDITDAKVAGERQRLLINELNHRVKNTLATVQSIASQTLRNARTLDQAREDFESRLLALSRAHDILTREQWEGAALSEVIAGAIAPYRQRGERRFRIEGPDLRLSPRMTLALSMAFQELVTNAVKYGALSNENGRIEIVWSVPRKEDGRHLALAWTESDGPPVQAPERRGFGSRLIERSLAQDLDGEVRIDFAAPGVVCTIDAPLSAP
jgi:PAS domain S-box-containing protein